MSDLSQEFRKSFLAYSKNPHHVKNKENLVNSASAIYAAAIKKHGLEPDQYIADIWEMVKPAVQGIKVSPDIAKTLDNLIRDLGSSDSEKETKAFHALNIAYNLTSPKKSCLREVLNNFLIVQDQIAREDFIITNRNFAGSFFLSNSDVSNVRAKKSVIDQLIKFASEDVFAKSRAKEDKYFPVSCNVNQKIQFIEKHIDSLSEKECDLILSRLLLQKINPILSAQTNPGDIRDNAEFMTDSGKKSALKIHSFNDKWFFTFLAKMVKTIQEALGIKTSAENLLESSVDEAQKAGVTLK